MQRRLHRWRLAGMHGLRRARVARQGDESMKILAIYTTWDSPIKKVPYGIEVAYLVKANYAYLSKDDADVPSMHGATCVANMEDRLLAAGYVNAKDALEVNAKLLAALKDVRIAYDAASCASEVGESIHDLMDQIVAAIAKAEPAP
jgi:hypothetical protein